MSNQWSIPLDKLAERASGNMEFAARKITLEIFRRVIRKSPVDTGRFRANWNVSYQTIDSSTSESKVASRADSEVAKVLDLPVGGVMYLTNSLPYADRLENGYSQQAPVGMVRVTVAEISQAIAAGLK